jgi:hypothetical protein
VRKLREPQFPLLVQVLSVRCHARNDNATWFVEARRQGGLTHVTGCEWQMPAERGTKIARLKRRRIPPMNIGAGGVMQDRGNDDRNWHTAQPQRGPHGAEQAGQGGSAAGGKVGDERGGRWAAERPGPGPAGERGYRGDLPPDTPPGSVPGGSYGAGGGYQQGGYSTGNFGPDVEGGLRQGDTGRGPGSRDTGSAGGQGRNRDEWRSDYGGYGISGAAPASERGWGGGGPAWQPRGGQAFGRGESPYEQGGRQPGAEQGDEYGEAREIGRGMDAWAVPGPQTGRGPQGYRRSEASIRDDVCERLTRHGHVDARSISVSVENGEVILEGDVDSRAAKRMAEDAAESVSGVRDVHNRLRVRHRD